MKKPIYKSWTVWLNLLVLAVSLVDSDYLKLLGMSDLSIAIFLATMAKITALGNIVLRVFFSKTELTYKQEN